MMEPAKSRMRNNVSEPLEWAFAGRVLPKRNASWWHFSQEFVEGDV